MFNGDKDFEDALNPDLVHSGSLVAFKMTVYIRSNKACVLRLVHLCAWYNIMAC